MVARLGDAPRWFVAHSNDDEVIGINTAQVADGTASFRVIVRQRSVYAETTGTASVQYDSITQRLEYDCRYPEDRTVSAIFYLGNKAVFTMEESQEWTSLAPGAVGASIQALVCKAFRPNAKR
jgi:hypothetical protein